MGKAPAFLMYASDFYVDTNEWTVDEVGIYTRLLLSEWVNGSLPKDNERLSRIAGCSSKKFQKRWRIIEKKFHLNGNERFINLKLEEVRNEQRKYRELQSEKGKLGGRPLKSRSFDSALTERKPEAKPEESSSSSSSSSNNKDKRIKNIYSGEFEIFWKEYPNKKNKPSALKEWNKIKPDIQIILSALEIQKDEKQKLVANGKFCPEWPHPERWIKNKRWEDESMEIQKHPGLRAWGQEIMEEENARK